MQPLLSIIIPFHNSVGKCERLLDTLSCSDSSCVEVIFIDDGSIDETYIVLKKYKEKIALPVQLINQQNKGPGGARNTGIDFATGKYLWFVDSDDDIDLGLALSVIKKNINEDADFIDFEYSNDGIVKRSLPFEPGVYTVNEEVILKIVENFGRIWTKVFNKRVFDENSLRYPEFCIYEDNTLLFVLPLCVKKFIKSNASCYKYNMDSTSITRGPRGLRYYDRIRTAKLGFESSVSKVDDTKILAILKKHLIRLYLINTGEISRSPSREWVDKIRIMRHFKEDIKSYNMVVKTGDILPLISQASLFYQITFFTLYAFSSILPSQKQYFEKIRLAAWKTESHSGNRVPSRRE